MKIKPSSKQNKIKVSSSSEYFALPKSEREFMGLYILPFALPCELLSGGKDGWDSFYKRIKEEYPLQWFFRVWLFSYKNPVFSFFKKLHWKYNDLRFFIENTLNPCCPRWRKTLPRHEYSDVCNVMEESNFNLILDFYYQNLKNNHVDWNSDESHSKFYNRLCENVNWIEVERKQLHIQMQESITGLHLTREDISKKMDEYSKMESELYKKETEILKWFCENRGFFWD